MDEYVSKPIDFNQLYSILAQMFPLGSDVQTGERPVFTMATEGAEPVAFPEIPGVDVKAGLLQWRDEKVYRNALLRFAQAQGGKAELIRTALQAGELAEAKALVHTLKGASGSLCAVSLAVAATALESGLRRQESNWDPLLTTVENALTELVASCHVLEENVPTVMAKETIPVPSPKPHHTLLMQQIAQALRRGRAMEAEELLPEIAHWLQGTVYESDVARLMTQVDDTDCTGAIKGLDKLAQALGVNLHGNNL